MASKPQSPGPNLTTSQPKQARSRKAAAPSEQTAAGRAGSAGGVVLEKEQAAKAKSAPPAKVAPKATSTTTAAENEKDAAIAPASTGPNRPRRKPRKLNKEPTSTQNATASSSKGPPAAAASQETLALPAAAANEMEALKSRVRGLEAKVEQLYSATEARTGRSPRRRGKGRKGSSATQVPTISTVTEPGRVEEEEEADEELDRLEDELETARRDLDLYTPRTRPRTKRSTSGETDYVEEIPRDDIGDGGTVTTGDRQVTLTGNYRIPLPSSVSMNDVKNIQSGVSAAQNVAKSFLEQRRAARAAAPQTTPADATPKAAPKAAPKATPKSAAKKPAQTSSMEVVKDDGNGGTSWGEWFGGYSMAISRAVKNIEAEAALENQKAGGGRPPQARAASAKKAGTKAGRPGMRQGNLSSEQVDGLMR